MYATLALIMSFVLPVHPMILMIALLDIHHEIALARKLHEEALKAFQAYQLIQHAIIQQVLEGIEEKIPDDAP